jgi:hypothetical protein
MGSEENTPAECSSWVEESKGTGRRQVPKEELRGVGVDKG